MKTKLDKLIYGNDLDSIAYSFLTGIPIVCERLEYPQTFEFFKPEHRLELLKITNESNQMRTPDGVFSLNDSKINVLKKLLLFLSLLGKIKFVHDVKFISLSQSNCLKICSESNKIHEIEFDKLYVINDSILKDSDYETIEHNKSRVIEKFHIGKNLGFRTEVFRNETDFIKNVYINYSSSTSCTIESFLPHDKINELEYSFFYVKYSLINLFRQYGFDYSDAKELLTPIKKEIYESKTIQYNDNEFVKQIRFSLEDYLCGQTEKNLELQDVYQLIVAHKFSEMSTQMR